MIDLLQLRGRLVAEFQKHIVDWEPGTILARIELLENALVELARKRVAQWIKGDTNFFLDSDASVINTTQGPFVLLVNKKLFPNPSLSIEVVRVSRDCPPEEDGGAAQPASSIEHVGSIDGAGRYRTITISLPDDLIDQEDLAEEIFEIFRTGYWWLERQLMSAVSKSQSDLELETLATLKRHLYIRGKESLENKLWLVVAHDDKIFYGINPEVISRIEKAAKAASGSLPMSSALVTANLVTTEIPLAKSFSLQALQSKHVIPLDLRTAPYSSIRGGFQLAQKAIYERQMSLAPIVMTGRSGLLVGYPSRLDSEVLPVIDAARSELVKAVHDKASTLKPAFRRLQQVTVGKDVSASIGTLLGALLKELMNP